MPLPPPVEREQLHLRRIELSGFRRFDGLFDIEARMVDTKTQELTVGAGRKVAPGEAIHDIAVRLVVDEDLNVLDAFASTDAAPHGICPQATGSLQAVKGLRIGAGWTSAIRGQLVGSKGCTHLTELLKPLASVAFQTMWKVRESRPVPVRADGSPTKIDSCYAYASHREVVLRRWPAYHSSA